MMHTGSSPLARGLHHVPGQQAALPGIIPARAGFTAGSGRACSTSTDHPRSRGVYPASSSGNSASCGSSPLARGLRRGRGGDGPLSRIIPARAGFTEDRRRGPGAGQDHPRSRGVYDNRHSVLVTTAGSSPLARGLPAVAGPRRHRHRIIPARAGFTPGRDARKKCAPDHPRSRGVYSPPTYYVTHSMGSSPLARGLPAQARVESSVRGIIPARAGFTGGAALSPRPGRDHPRSRGVYDGKSTCAWLPCGSSPLARGLRNDGVLPLICCRIIPARAGFTHPPVYPQTSVSDHPRSRGVY